MMSDHTSVSDPSTAEEELETPIDFGKKKSKKPAPAGHKRIATLVDEDLEPDYTYDALLTRVRDDLTKIGRNISTGRLRVPPPILAAKGTKRVCITNFSELCTFLVRPIEHVAMFILVETGDPNSLDGEKKKLTIKGKYDQRKIESILTSYVKTYVACQVCKSQATRLEKEERLMFIKCEVCSSKSSVAKVERGFRAVTKRVVEGR